MSPEEIHYYFLLGEKHNYIHDIWDYAKCCDQCSHCPAGPACELLSSLPGEFEDSYDKLFYPHRSRLESNTLAYYEDNYPELFI